MKQQNENGFKRIEVETSRDGVHTKKAFTGRILVVHEWEGERYLVAETAHGKFAVHFCNVIGFGVLELFDSFKELKEKSDDHGLELPGGTLPEEVIEAVAAEVGEPYVVELDI